MILLDILIIAGIIIGFILGFKDGFVRKMVGLIGFILATLTAVFFAGKLGRLIESLFRIEYYLAEIIGGILILITIITIFVFLKRVVHPFDKVNNLINQLDALTLSGHKFHAPKGVGALVVDKKLALKPQITGGGHESGLRAGTSNVAAIVGFGLACELAAQRVAEVGPRLAALQERLERGLSELGGTIFGRGAQRLPNTSYFAFPGIEGETLVIALGQAGVACAIGAACSSGAARVSTVLTAMGVPEELGRGAVRLSLGKDSTQAEVDGFLQALARVLERLRGLAAVVA